jgi:hypothetical protein
MKRPGTLTLARDGHPCVAVCLPRNPVAAEEFAAEELRRHLALMCGEGAYPWSNRRLRETARAAGSAVAICLNDRDAALEDGVAVAGLQLGTEAFHLETQGDTLHILGGSPRGLLYGVYELLERLGCRWYTPSVARIPTATDLVVPPLRVTRAPAFEFRDLWMWEAYDPAWWVRNRLNGFQCPVPEYMGGNMAYGLFVHTFETLLPPGEFFAAHPEYFSLVAGTRRKEGAQICLTHPDVLQIVTERVRARMRADPRATIFSVSQNDCLGACECERCRAVVREEGAESGPLLRFVNGVAAGLAAEFPDKLIDTLAYQYTLDPPRRVRPHTNVRVRLCPINCCQGHAFGSCEHPESRRFLRALRGWQRITGQMYIWHYATNFAHYPLPMPDYDELHANLERYHRMGVYGVFVQGMGEEGGGAETMALRAFVLSKLLWNPRQPVWPLVDEFLAACYGQAAAHVRTYLDIFHRRVRDDRTLHPSLYDPPTAPLYDEPTVAPADRALARGEQRVTGAERLRVQLLRAGLAYARLAQQSRGAFHLRGSRYGRDVAAWERPALARATAVWRAAGVRRLRESAPFETSLHQLRMVQEPQRVAWLRGHGQRLAVVPGLGGRLLEWHAAGRQWLAGPDPANGAMPYPLSGGAVEFAIFGLYGYRGFSEDYAACQTPTGLKLTVTLSEGLRLTRRIRLQPGGMDVHSRITNVTSGSLAVTWGASWQLAATPDAQVRFVDGAGNAQAFDSDALPSGLDKARVLEGGCMPHGSWRVTMGGLALEQRVSGPIHRAIVGREPRVATLALDLRSEVLTLAAGAWAEWRQAVRVSRNQFVSRGCPKGLGHPYSETRRSKVPTTP